MLLTTRLLWLALAIRAVSPLQIPFHAEGYQSTRPLISDATKIYIENLLDHWGSSGLSVAVVRRDEKEATGWKHEFSAHGIAQAGGARVTPDSVFAIASNSKLFLAFSVGLLISNETLAKERGERISWSTKIRDLIPEWKLLDDTADHSVTLQDALSHRTGMPRHDFSQTARAGGVKELISTLRFLRPSAEFRETFQYNNLMYQTLSYLPHVLLNQSFESYVAQHLFEPLNMTSSTYSVAEAEERGTLANGFDRDEADIFLGKNGTLKATVPYFLRPGEERTWAGAGGVLTSAEDLSIWVSMLLNNGRHPYTNKTIVPEDVVERCAFGRIASEGKPEFPEWSAKVYGAGQWQYSYRGHEILEHGGSNPGYKTQVARLPNDNLGVVVLSNDEIGGPILEAVKFRIIDEILGLEEIDWNGRFEKQRKRFMNNLLKITPRPEKPKLPGDALSSLSSRTFHHPTYGTIQPCFVTTDAHDPKTRCSALFSSRPVRRLLKGGSSYSDAPNATIEVPTLVARFDHMFTTHLRLEHFDGNLFNLTVLWTNAEVREREGYENGGDLLLKWFERFEVEWVHREEEGLAIRGGFWGREGPDSRSPSGDGKESAEVWFKRIA